MTDIRFDGRVALVTGAGAGLGRSHALALARRGARVVVNDLGASLSGEAGHSHAAERVAEEIRAAGGQAIADASSVTDPQAMQAAVARAVEAFGRVDILIANAGILRDRSFAKMELEDFRTVLDVHLMGAVTPLKALWPQFKAQGFGRVVVTGSGAGLYGNFGQSNYGAAKMALIGLMNTLKLEGARDGVRVNAIIPVAATRMTEGVLPAGFAETMTPEAVTAGVLHLVSDDAPDGVILSAAGGLFSQVRIVESLGADLGPEPAPEALRDQWAQVADPIGQREWRGLPEEIMAIVARRASKASG